MWQQYRRRLFSFVAAILLLGLLLGVYREHAVAPSSASQTVHSEQLKMATLKGRRFSLRIADTMAAREQGLSGTAELPANEAMLFVFQQPDPACFWMKDMHYNLDILWFDVQRQLIYQQQNLSPDTYPNNYCPPARATYVLEVDGGTAQQLQLKLGDTLDLSSQP